MRLKDLKRANLWAVAGVSACVGIGVAQPGAVAAPAPVAAVRDTALPTVAAVTTPATAVPQLARAVLEGVGIESGAEAAQVQAALGALADDVRRQSDPKALTMAFKAYFAYKAAHPEDVRKPYLYFVDYGLDATTPRGYVFDMNTLEVVEGPFTVAHGRGSAPGGSSMPTRFSNREGSAASSLGLFLTQEVYSFTGHSGGRAYSSTGLRLKGLSGRFNDAARQRRVVVHGAPYVTASKAGRSEGCPAMEPARARRLLPKIGNGGLVFLFSPTDRAWMSNDPWAGLAAG